MIEIVKVAELKFAGGRSFWFRFSDGSEGVHDFSGLLDEGGPMVEPLRKPELFQRAFVACGVPSWPNGFDLDAIALHREMKELGALSKRQAAE